MTARVKPGKREVAKVVSVLGNENYDSPEEMALAILSLVYDEILPQRFKHMVVGQLHPREGSVESDEEGRDMKMAFGPFPTAGAAKKAGESLALSHATGDSAKWWHLEIYDGTPGEFYAQLKKKRARKGFLDSAHPREVRQAMREAWIKKNPGMDIPPELQGNGWEDLEWWSLFREDFEYLLDEEG